MEPQVAIGDVWAKGLKIRSFPIRLIRLIAAQKRTGTAKWRRWISPGVNLSLECPIMTRHKTHDPQDLVDALEHVVYEIWKYRQSVAYYGQIRHVGGDAAIEFRVLHHRVLLEFFFARSKHQDNIVAWEYIHDWQRTQDGKKLTWFDDYMQRCHTMLAHISKTRSEMAKRGLKDWGNAWQVVEPHLDQTICNFLSGLAKDHKDICLRWVNEWSKGSHPGNDVLADLAAILGRP